MIALNSKISEMKKRNLILEFCSNEKTSQFLRTKGGREIRGRLIKQEKKGKDIFVKEHWIDKILILKLMKMYFELKF